MSGPARARARRTRRRAGALVALAAAALLGTAACVDRGPTVSEQRQVGDFTSVSVSNGVEATVSVGGRTSVIVTTGKNLLPEVTTRVDGSRLVVTIDGSSHRDVVVAITAPAITEVDASASARVTVEGVSGGSFSVGTSSQSTLMASGTALELVLDASSQSTADLSGLTATSVRANVSSQSKGIVRATDSVTGDVSSQSTLTILGSPPRVDVSTSSDGKVLQR